MDIYERLDDMNADTAEARAAHILHGLGFTAKMQQTPTKDFSGGWRMRIALARYIFFYFIRNYCELCIKMREVFI